ncbi:MAG: hypothetical protein DVB33_10815, partial [Verrucomicrobia bacterium]
MMSNKKQKPSATTASSHEAVGTPHAIRHHPPTELAQVTDVTDLQDCQTVSRWFSATAKRVAALAALPLALLCGGQSASAQAPTPTATQGSHTITVFPDRDFVSLSLYTNLAPNTSLTVEVFRGGVLSGQCLGMVPDTAGLAEVNHPGGYCWGIVPALGTAITPDIKGGDVVRVKGTANVGGVPTAFAEQTTVADLKVTVAPFVPTNSVGIVQVQGYANDPAANGGRGAQLTPFTVDIVSPRFSDGSRIIFGSPVFDVPGTLANTNWTATFTLLSDGVTALTAADVLQALPGTASIGYLDAGGNGLSSTIAENPAPAGPFSATCNAPLDAPVLSTSAAGLFYTSTNINVSEARTFSVTNTGAGVFGQLHITSMTLEGADAASFIAPTIAAGGNTVAVGSNISYTVTMRATTAGEKNATLVIHSDNQTGDVRLPLTGFAYSTKPNAAYLVARPALLDMGARSLGVSSAPYTVMVYNIGDASAT